MAGSADFRIVLRGYDMGQVDGLIERARGVLDTGTSTDRTATERALREPDLRQRFRGYDRAQVERALTRLADELASG